MRPANSVADLRGGDHVCHIFETEEQHRVVVTSFLRCGLERGEKVIYILDASAPHSILDYLMEDGLDGEPFLDSGQLSILTTDDTFSRAGLFSPQRMIDLLGELTERASTEGYSALRVTSGMTWALCGQPGSERLIEYEVQLNRFLPGSQCLVMCQFDQRTFEPEVLLDVLRTHPIAIVGTEMYENAYYIPPSELLSGDFPKSTLRRWMENLTARKQAKETLWRSEATAADGVEQRQAAELLHASQQRFQDFVEQSVDGISLVDEQGAIIEWNRSLQQITGLKRDDVLGQPLFDVMLQPAEPDPGTTSGSRHNEANTLAFLSTGQAPPWVKLITEMDIHRPDGVRRTIQQFLFPIKTESGYMLGGIYRDITERKRVEDALRESEGFLQSVFDGVQDGISVLDCDLNFIRSNAWLERICGDEAGTAGRKCYEICWQRQSPCPNCPAALTLETGKVHRQTMPHLSVDGRKKWLEVSTFPLRNGDGHQVGIIEHARDITKRKQAEEELRRRDAILEAASFAAEQFLRRGTWEESVQETLRMLGVAAQVSRVFVYENLTDEAGVHHPRQRYEWVGPNISSHIDNPPLQNRSWRDAGLARWEATLSLGHSLCGNASVLPQGEQDILSVQSVRSLVVVPVFVGQAWWGAIGFHECQSEREWSEGEIDALRMASDILGAAIHRERAEEEIRQGSAQLEGLRQMGLETAAEMNLSAQLHSVVTRAAELLGGAAGELYLHRPVRNVIEKAAAFGGILARQETVLQRGKGLPGRIWDSGEPLIVGDHQNWEGQRGISERVMVGAMVGVPILWGPPHGEGEFLGVIVVSSKTGRSFSQADAALLGQFATQAAIAIQNARLLEAERQHRELAEALEEAARAVNSTLDVDQVLDRILEQVERIIEGDAFNIMLIEDGIARIARSRGYDLLHLPYSLSDVAVPVDAYPSLMTMRETGESIVIPDTAVDPNWTSPEGPEWRRSYVAAPIRVGNVTVGFVNANATQPGKFGAAEARRLVAFANHAATAIENARLYRQQLLHTEELEQRVHERTIQVQAQYAQLEAILHSTSEGIIVTDAAGKILQTNSVASAWLSETLLADEAERLRRVVSDLARRSEERPDAVLELRGLDLELKAAPISEPENYGSMITRGSAVVAVHDVTELKSLDRMKTRFVSNVSHELRTPVTTIKLYTALMQRTDPDQWADYLGTLAREAERQVGLVEDILQISSIDAGRLALELRPTLLNELVESAVACHQVLAQERGHTLSCCLNEPGPVAQIDRDRLMQVLNNLLENAIWYTPSGGRVEISTGTEEDDERVWATIAVKDTGMGIPKEEIPHTFERFFRGDKPQSMQISGTGLGLAIVKEIVEMHRGRITVESEVDVGSTFTVWLPESHQAQSPRAAQV